MPGRESQKIRTSGRAGGSRRPAAIATLLLLLSVGAGHGQWVQSSGPKGTSVRSLGSAGGTLFVGTWDWIFLSGDRGRTWSTDTGVGSAGNILLFQGEYFTGTSIGVKKRAAVEGSRPWTPGGLDNRYVTAMAELGPYLYALTFSGVFRSLDGGVVWDSLPMGVPKGSTTAMSAADGAIFVGTSGNGVYRSLDSGNTWVASEVALPASNVDEIAAGSDVFARTPKGLYRSTDRGGSWKELAVDTGNGHPTAMLLSGADLYVGTSAGWVLRSPDRGNTWTRAQASPSEWPIMHLAVVAADIFAATGTEVFRSSDQGNTWIPVDLLDASIGSFAESGGDLFASRFGDAAAQNPGPARERWLLLRGRRPE